MRHLLALTISMALVMISCATTPQVAQGTVVSCDEANKVVIIRDQEKPGGMLEFQFEGAEVGASPHPGDIVRIAYQMQDGKLRATRIMNISSQKELKAGK